MPIPVTELKPGDRVVLNCPKARGTGQKREARFDGIFKSMNDAMQGVDLLVTLPETEEFIARGGLFAKFLLMTSSQACQIMEYPGGGPIHGLPPMPAGSELSAAFVVDADGGLHEEEGRRIFIERRLGRAAER